MIKQLIDHYCKFLTFLMVICMALMVVMVFTNVVL
ncbi:MAG: TRAP transporter small permease, partial [Limnohabitans sp.]|nr:TRAP transporter small permease [Limnohabitans sp.]